MFCSPIDKRKKRNAGFHKFKIEEYESQIIHDAPTCSPVLIDSSPFQILKYFDVATITRLRQLEWSTLPFFIASRKARKKMTSKGIREEKRALRSRAVQTMLVTESTGLRV